MAPPLKLQITAYHIGNDKIQFLAKIFPATLQLGSCLQKHGKNSATSQKTNPDTLGDN